MTKMRWPAPAATSFVVAGDRRGRGFRRDWREEYARYANAGFLTEYEREELRRRAEEQQMMEEYYADLRREGQ